MDTICWCHIFDYVKRWKRTIYSIKTILIIFSKHMYVGYIRCQQWISVYHNSMHFRTIPYNCFLNSTTVRVETLGNYWNVFGILLAHFRHLKKLKITYNSNEVWTTDCWTMSIYIQNKAFGRFVGVVNCCWNEILIHTCIDIKWN